MNGNTLFKKINIIFIWCWLALFSLAPALIALITSLRPTEEMLGFPWQITFQHYVALFNAMYLKIFLRSFSIATLCSFICLTMAYPFAYCLSRINNRYKHILLILVIIPFWTSSLIRTYAIVAILKAKGILNTLLLMLGIINHPLPLLYTNTATIIGLVYSLLPFMILPLYASIEQLDNRLIDAGRDLGASEMRIFLKIILPLTMPGILAGFNLVFLPAMTLFYIPDILGGAKSLLLGNLIQDQFLVANNWPMGSAISIMLTFLMGTLLFIYWRSNKNRNQSKAYYETFS